MSNCKAKVDQNEVTDFVRKQYNGNSVKFIFGGESSQAFSFCVGEEEYILRVNKSYFAFRKDQVAHERYASSRMPIPRIVDVERFSDTLYYAVSDKMPGEVNYSFSSAVRPGLIQGLDKIHDVDVSSAQGFGYWNLEGNGSWKTWRDYLMHVGNIKPITEDDPELVNIVMRNLQHYSSFTPNGKWLVHGDYGFGNTLMEGKHVSGVIDWANSLYGDFVFDLAWMDFWLPSDDGFFSAKFQDVSDFEERMLACKLFTGICCMSFFSSTEQPLKYNWVKNKILAPMIERYSLQ